MKTWARNLRVIEPLDEYRDMIYLNHSIMRVYGVQRVSWYGMRHPRERTMTQLEAIDLGLRSCQIANNMIRKMINEN